MYIGIGKISLSLPGNQNLKGKRQIIQSLISRIRNKYCVSIAEVENNDVWQIATIGISTVSNDAQHAAQILDKIFTFVAENQGNYYLTNQHKHILNETMQSD